MFQLDRILVPTDFSNNSLAAIGQVGELARRFHSHVTLLYVEEMLPLAGALGLGITSNEALRAAHFAARRKQLAEFGAVELNDVPVKRVVCSGDAAKVIVERAREEQSNLILMPARGGGVFRRFLLGSVTAKVLHDAECPVWTGAHIPEPVNRAAEIRSILCAVDFGRQTGNTIDWAAGLASALDAKLAVVHAVLEMPPNLPDRYAFQWHEESHSGAYERLRQLLLDQDVTAEALIVSDGDVPKSLAAAVQREGADLLVIGRSCAEGPAGRPGSQTFPIVCGAECPVVSV